jgi:MFS family permease
VTVSAATARRRLPRGGGFTVLGLVLALFFFAAAAPSALYALYQTRWHFSVTTLTLVFAVYAVALLLALLTTGSLSDVVGRRPVLLAAIVAQVVAMALFAAADGVGWVFAARAVQGLATGLATSALSAGLVDLAPPGRASSASVVTTGGPTTGQALGAIGAGALVQFAPAPTVLVYVVLLVGFLAAAVAVWFLPEPVVPGRLSARVFVPRAGVPREARPAFLAAAPCVVAVWALSGLHLSLGPSLAAQLLGSDDRLLSALVVTLLTGCGAVAAVSARRLPPRSVLLAACVLLIAGMVVTLAGIVVGGGSAPVFYVGTAVAGAGFGLGLLGTVSVVMSAAPAAERGRVAATMFVLAYLSFGLPAVAAGAATSTFGLRPVATVYGLAVGVLALLALVATLVVRPARPAPPATEVLAEPDDAPAFTGRVYDAEGELLPAVLTVVDARGRQVSCGQAREDGSFHLPVPGPVGPGLLVVRPCRGPAGPVVLPVRLGGSMAHDVVVAPARPAAPAES